MQPVQPAASSQGGIRAYARHREARGLPGARHESVRRAIEAGRLSRSVRHVDGAIVIDFDAADREWQRNTDYTKAPVNVVLQSERRRPRVAPDDDDAPIPIERLSVMTLDDDLISLVDLGADNENEGYLLSAAGAEWLAKQLLEQAAIARPKTSRRKEA